MLQGKDLLVYNIAVNCQVDPHGRVGQAPIGSNEERGVETDGVIEFDDVLAAGSLATWYAMRPL